MLTPKFRYLIVDLEDEGIYGTNDHDKLQEFISADTYEVLDVVTGESFRPVGTSKYVSSID